MTPTERDELERAIRAHFPGLPDGAVEWLTDGAAFDAANVVLKEGT